jgi:NADH-quinone oxidoreductase subunit L
LVKGELGTATEWSLLALATAVALVGIFGTWKLLQPEALTAAREAPAETGFQKVLARKYYVDEIYDTIVVRPLVWVSDRVLWRTVDAFVIDGVGVNGSARVARFLGWIGSTLQTGRVGVYLGVFVIGALVLLRALLRS